MIMSNANGYIVGCGMKIRSDDPTAMKNFIQSVQSRVNELKAFSGERQSNINGKRVSFWRISFETFATILCC